MTGPVVFALLGWLPEASELAEMFLDDARVRWLQPNNTAKETNAPMKINFGVLVNIRLL
jgi:hypothetical protein